MLFAMSAVFVLAQAGGEIGGWAWSSVGGDSGIGWVSFSGANHGSTSYGVTAGNGGNLSGYAWNNVTGWISFDDTSGCPGSGACKAKINNGSHEVTGWARACSVFQSGCSGGLRSDAERGGWDGWISLNCSNTNSCGTSNYKVTVDELTGCWNGYAWGGDVVVGWIKMSGTSPDYGVGDRVTCPEAGGNPAAANAPDVDLKVNGGDGPIAVSPGDGVTLSWTVSGGTATSCTASNDWSGNKSTSGGSQQVNNITSEKTFTLTCTGPGGTDQDTVGVTLAGSINNIECSVSPTANVKTGDTVTWSVTSNPTGGSGNYIYTWTFLGGGHQIVGTPTPKSIQVKYSTPTPPPKTARVTVSDGTLSTTVDCSNSLNVQRPPPSFKEVAPH